ncbi:Retrotransposable element Tf2 protein type 1-like protein, partial [Dinothrombium tinctorium]
MSTPSLQQQTTSYQQLDKYGGRNDNVKIQTWIKLYEGAALEWFGDEVAPSIQTLTWQEVKSKIIQRFGISTATPLIDAQRRLLRRSESVEDYYKDKMGLLRQTGLSEHEMVQQLTEGLPIEWKLTMTAARPLTPNSWIEVAQQLESHFKQQQKQQLFRNKPRTERILVTVEQKKNNKPRSPCRYCLQRGQTVYHWHSDCPFNTRLNKRKECSTSQTPMHPPQDSEQKPLSTQVAQSVSCHNKCNADSPSESSHIHQYSSIKPTVKPEALFHVLQNFQYPVLIGLDIGQQFGLKIDLKSKTASMTIVEQPLRTILAMKPTQSQQLKELLQTHKHVFSQDGMDIGRISIAKHHIATVEHPPIQLLHRAGKNQHVDALSRSPVMLHLTREELVQHQQDEKPNFINKPIIVNGLIMVKHHKINKTYVPKSLRSKLLNKFHEDHGHPGKRKTIQLISNYYWWPDILRDIKKHVESCRNCQLVKTRHTPRYGQYIRPDHDLQPNDLWATIVTILNGLIKSGIKPKRILTDCHKNFASSTLNQFLRKYDIRHSYSTPYHPQTNGIVESVNGTIITKLRASLLDKPKRKWSTLLADVTKSYNNTPHDITGFSPRFLHFARQRTREHQEKRKESHDNKHKSSPFQIGDKVIREIPDNHPSSNKLSPKFTGPYVIVKRVTDVTYDIAESLSGESCSLVTLVKNAHVENNHIPVST